MRVTVEPKVAQEEDIFQPGKLVVHKEGHILILVSKAPPETRNCFSGIVLHTSNNQLFIHDQDWGKELFTKFVGKIVLEQE